MANRQGMCPRTSTRLRIENILKQYSLMSQRNIGFGSAAGSSGGGIGVPVGLSNFFSPAARVPYFLKLDPGRSYNVTCPLFPLEKMLHTPLPYKHFHLLAPAIKWVTRGNPLSGPTFGQFSDNRMHRADMVLSWAAPAGSFFCK